LNTASSAKGCSVLDLQGCARILVCTSAPYLVWRAGGDQHACRQNCKTACPSRHELLTSTERLLTKTSNIQNPTTCLWYFYHPAVPYMHAGPASKSPAHAYNSRDSFQDTSSPFAYPTRVRAAAPLELNARGVRPAEVSVSYSQAPKVRCLAVKKVWF
jgi:hypothetical protein